MQNNMYITGVKLNAQKVFLSGFQKLQKHYTHRHTHTDVTERIITPHSRVVKLQ